VDTSGYASAEVFDKICEMVDVFLYDLKIIDEERHLKYTGVSVEPILDNLRRLSRESDGVIIRLPIVTGITDTETNINQIVKFLSSLRNIRELGLLPYNHLGDQKYKRLGMINRMVDILSPSPDRINKIQKTFEKKGYEVRIGG
jgi:pyruvate formate lyase activating enzyme